MILIDRIVTLRSRSPCGERGLKYSFHQLSSSVPKSLPVRGAWIEIYLNKEREQHAASLPVRGAWIEIPANFRADWHCAVAPRAGSVD